MKYKFWFTAITLACFLSASNVSFADDGSLLTIVQNMQNQMFQMQKIIDTQTQKINFLESRELKTESFNILSADEFNEKLKENIGDSGKWLKGLKFGGDLRLRYEALNEKHSSAANDRNRFRFRLRFGFG